MNNEKYALNYLSVPDTHYLLNDKRCHIAKIDELLPKHLSLFQVEEISFEDKSPHKEALENVISSVNIEGVNFIYIILGDSVGVHFYYGLAKDISNQTESALSINDIGTHILESSIKGNFRGSKVKCVTPEDKSDIVDGIARMKYCSVIEGVPGSIKDNEKFQGVDRLVDVMQGDKFSYVIIAKPLSKLAIIEIEKELYQLYSQINTYAKKSVQSGTSSNESKTFNETKGNSHTKGTNHSTSEQHGTNSGITITNGTSKTTGKNQSSGGSSSSTGTNSSEGTNYSKGETDGKSSSMTTSKGNNDSSTVNSSKSTGETEGTSTSENVSLEFVNKGVQEWIKYLDDVLFPRLDYGKGKGIFVTSIFLSAENKAVLKKLENTTTALYSGETGNKVPLRVSNGIQPPSVKMLQNFQVPFGYYDHLLTEEERSARFVLSQFMTAKKEIYLGNWITNNELAMIAGLPQKEVVGLSLKEEVEFGLNHHLNIKDENKIHLGKLVQSGNILNKSDVVIDKANLDKHIFITGVTGSGKTTTCHKILIASDLPFLIIEPAKTEYRILMKEFEDLLVFSLGKDFVTPFRLNPFEFFEHESITSRVDMLKASIESAFDMEAAIPQIIESAMYECYKDYGWNITTNKNERFENPFKRGVQSFPTLSDLIQKTTIVIEQQGFDERLKNDYNGSIKARLQGLLVGSKGLMLDTPRSIDFKELLHKRVVLELEEIRSTSEKSLIMGFILTNLMEAIKATYYETDHFKHITLIEEAHRLLSKYTPGDSLNKKQGVETFTDMLAEIRKYGESLIIVDQIPNKLTPEVLKNTNTKIVHKLFARDDKDAIGDTMALSNDQKEFLSNLETGRAIVFTEGLSKAIQVQIENLTHTTSSLRITDAQLKEKVFVYYAEHYQQGVIIGTQFFKHRPTMTQLEDYIQTNGSQVIRTVNLPYILSGTNKKKSDDISLRQTLGALRELYDMKKVAYFLLEDYYTKKGKKTKKITPELETLCLEVINGYIEDTLDSETQIKLNNQL